MTSTLDVTAPSREPEPGLVILKGKRVVVHAPIGSYSSQCASEQLTLAERVAEELAKLFSPPPERLGSSIAIYLVDPVGVAGAPPHTADSTENSILRVVQPDAPMDPLAGPLCRLLIARWFGAPAAEARVIVDGVA